MKWFQWSSVLVLAVALAGCGKGETPPKDDANNAMLATQSPDETKDDSNYNPEKERLQEEKELFESENKNTRYAALEDASDYISLVELSSDAAGGVSLDFIKNYKGALSTVEIKTPKGLTPNQEYIIFYRDTDDGTILPTHATYGLYRVDGSDDDLLRYMEKNYADREEDEPEVSEDTSAKENKSTTKSTSTNENKKSSERSDASTTTRSEKTKDASEKSAPSEKDADTKQSSKRSTDLTD